MVRSKVREWSCGNHHPPPPPNTTTIAFTSPHPPHHNTTHHTTPQHNTPHHNGAQCVCVHACVRVCVHGCVGCGMQLEPGGYSTAIKPRLKHARGSVCEAEVSRAQSPMSALSVAIRVLFAPLMLPAVVLCASTLTRCGTSGRPGLPRITRGALALLIVAGGARRVGGESSHGDCRRFEMESRGRLASYDFRSACLSFLLFLPGRKKGEGRERG